MMIMKHVHFSYQFYTPYLNRGWSLWSKFTSVFCSTFHILKCDYYYAANSLKLFSQFFSILRWLAMTIFFTPWLSRFSLSLQFVILLWHQTCCKVVAFFMRNDAHDFYVQGVFFMAFSALQFNNPPPNCFGFCSFESFVFKVSTPWKSSPTRCICRSGHYKHCKH